MLRATINVRNPLSLVTTEPEELSASCEIIGAFVRGPLSLLTTLSSETMMRAATLLRCYYFNSPVSVQQRFRDKAGERGWLILITMIHALRMVNVVIDRVSVIHTLIMDYCSEVPEVEFPSLLRGKTTVQILGLLDLPIEIVPHDHRLESIQALERQYIATTKLEQYRDLQRGRAIRMFRTYVELGDDNLVRQRSEEHARAIHVTEFSAYYLTSIPLKLITSTEVSIFVVYYTLYCEDKDWGRRFLDFACKHSGQNLMEVEKTFSSLISAHDTALRKGIESQTCT
ncbi:hypothetical protein GMRT_14358 [Giardia muris]|uniref:Uncharacterized protein n=1 Tax=Giardia muris TaxID=5742 RepID=A0A4Z1SQT7_GIAMU|nr:hypothetical protein GMRT_14358 [Giardia muris]|eukprot:TNJ28206.1 hypothetical protein GMRT_14358 [Giardia muris]